MVTHEPGGYAQQGVDLFVSVGVSQVSGAGAQASPAGASVAQGTTYRASIVECGFRGRRDVHRSGGPIPESAFTSDVRSGDSRLSLLQGTCGIEITWSTLGSSDEVSPTLDPDAPRIGAAAFRRSARARGVVCTVPVDTTRAEHGRRAVVASGSCGLPRGSGAGSVEACWRTAPKPLASSPPGPGRTRPQACIRRPGSLSASSAPGPGRARRGGPG